MDFRFTTPLDMPRGTHYGNNYWIFRSRKLNRRVTAFSNLEYENLLTLEMNSDIVFYCEQPCEQSVYSDGKYEKTVFDTYVVYSNGRDELQEVKYQQELDSDSKEGERSRHQIEIQKKWCLQNNFSYVLRTERQIETGEFTIRNLSILCAKARRFLLNDDANNEPIKHYLSLHSGVTIGQMIDAGRISQTGGLDYLADLYYRGVIRFTDIDSESLSSATGVMLNGM